MKIPRVVLLATVLAFVATTLAAPPSFACDKAKASDATADAKTSAHEGCAKAGAQTAEGKGCSKAQQTAEGKGCCAKKGTAVAKTKDAAPPEVAKKADDAPALAAAGATK